MGCSGSTAATSAGGKDPSDAIRRRVIVWECESDHGWSTYDAAVALTFELALTAGKRPTTWRQGQFTYRLDWAKMVQVNTSSGTERAIRRTEGGAQTHPSAAARVVSAADGRVTVMQGSVQSPRGSSQGSMFDHSLQPLVIWEVEADSGWTAYDIATSAKLELAMAALTYVETEAEAAPGTTFKYRIDPALGQQANVQTGKRRAIRRASVAWRWQSEGGAWHTYDNAIARALEAALPHKAPVTWSLAANGQAYRIDWAAAGSCNGPHDQVNTHSNVRRAVTRAVVVAPLTLPTVDVEAQPVTCVAANAPVDVAAISVAPAAVATTSVAPATVAATSVAPAAVVAPVGSAVGAGIAAVSVATTSTSVDAQANIRIDGADAKGSGAGAALAAGAVGTVAATGAAAVAGAATGALSGAALGAATGTAAAVGATAVAAGGEAGGAIALLAGIAVSVPIVGVIAGCMKEVHSSVERAKYNKAGAQALANRVTECAAALNDVLAAASKPLSPSLELELERLPPLLRQCAAFVEKFSKKMYLRKVLSGHNDAEQLRLVDKALTDCVQNVALSLGAAQLDMQRQQFDKLDQIAMLVSNANDNKTLAPDSAATKEIADLLGVQLDDMNSSLTEALSDIKARTESIDAKLDRLLAASAAGALGAATPDTATYNVADFAKQDFFRAFWDDYFPSNKPVLFDDFANVFEADFCPLEVASLSDAERAALQELIDTHPHDGMVSLVEWKRFCKLVEQSGLSFYDFVKCYAIGAY